MYDSKIDPDVVEKQEGEKLRRCMTVGESDRGGIVYAGDQSYSSEIRIKPEDVDDGVLDGRKYVLITGCYAYSTLQKMHHASFCFFFQKNKTRTDSLSVCNYGNEVD